MNTAADFARGKALAADGRLAEAAEAFRAAIAGDPDARDPRFHLGLTLYGLKQFGEAAEAFGGLVARAPDDIEARYHLALSYRAMDRLAAAEREARDVIARDPRHARAHSLLGVILNEAGRPADAVPLFAEAMRLDPAHVNAATNWVNTHQYLPGITEERLAQVHAAWARGHAPPAAPRVFANPRTTNRAVNVGFISPDLASHPVGALTVRMFENLDRARIRATVFSTRPQLYEDAVSARIARRSNWVTVYGMADADLAAFVQASGIDILIDLSGHMASHRLGAFAAKPAPVQATWLGYTGTTGVAAIDYIIANDVLIPRGHDAHYVERVIRLPGWHACFDPPAEAPAVGPLPAMRNGFVTFGCFNNPVKLSADTLASFAAILNRVPNARLKLKYKSLADEAARARLHALFAGHGIAPGRIDISGAAPRAEFLGAYNDADLVLDTFPYSGCITTCEASWMGCPVVAFRGATFAGRQAAAFLEAAGLSRFVAADRRGFEELAVGLARDLPALARERAALRDRIASGPVCDGQSFARAFSTAMEEIWGAWCRAA